MAKPGSFKIVNMVNHQVFTYSENKPWPFPSIESARSWIQTHNPWGTAAGLIPYGATVIPFEMDFPVPESLQPSSDLAVAADAMGLNEFAIVMGGQSIANKERALTLLLKDLAESYRTGKVAGPNSAGREWYGLANLLADYDMTASPGSGAWLKNLEAAVEVGFAKYVDRYSDAIAIAAKLLAKAGHCDSEASYEFNHLRAYTVIPSTHSDIERIYFWYAMPSAAAWYVIRLCKPNYDSQWEYAARSVSESDWKKGIAHPEILKYGDSRDPGYCGNLEDGLTRKIKDGFAFAVAFRKCFDPLTFQIEALAEEPGLKDAQANI